MRRLLWLQLLLVSLSSREINGDETPKDSTTIKPTPAASNPDEMSVHVDSTKPKTEDHDQTASALLVPLAVDGTTKAPVPFLDIESADPLPVTSKKRSSDSHTTSADGQSVEKVEPKEVIDDSKLNENSELIDIARVSRQPETSTTPQPQPTTVNASIPKKRQSQMESSESTENEFLPVNVINGVNDASANAYFTGDPKRRVSLSHDEFSQMLSEVLKQNPIYGNTQDNLKSLPSYLRPLQVEKLPDGDKDPESYLDDGRQTGFQVEDQRNNDSPIYISVPLNKDFQQNKQNKPRPQQQFPQVFQDKDVVLTPTTKRPPIDPPTDTIQKQHEHQLQQHQLQQQQQQQHEQQHQLQQQQQQQHKLQQLDQAIKDLQTFPILQPGASPPVSPSNPIIPAPLPFGPVLPANPNIPGQPPVDIVMHVNPSITHEPPPPNPLARPTSPSAAQPVSPAGHVHVLPPPTKVVPGPPSPKSSPSKNVTVPASCPTLVEFLNASRNVWNGIAEAGGLQAGLGIFFKAAGKVITTLTQCAKAILAEIGALFYQGVVEKMMGQSEEKPNSSSITTKNIKTADGRKQVEKNNQVKRNSVGNKKGRRYKKHVTPGAAGSSVNGDFIEAEIEEMDLEAEDEVTPDPGKVRGRKETENKAYDPFKESAQGNEDDSSGKKDNVEPGMY